MRPIRSVRRWRSRDLQRSAARRRYDYRRKESGRGVEQWIPRYFLTFLLISSPFRSRSPRSSLPTVAQRRRIIAASLRQQKKKPIAQNEHGRRD